jgi:hypothetical protein
MLRVGQPFLSPLRPKLYGGDRPQGKSENAQRFVDRIIAEHGVRYGARANDPNLG